MLKELHAVGAQEYRSPLSAWIVKQLVSFRTNAGLDVEAIAQRTRLSVAGIRKMESVNANPTVESIDLYVRACGKTLGEFFEPFIPAENPRYDRYIHRVVKAALEHPAAKQYVRPIVGLLNAAMATDAAVPEPQNNQNNLRLG